MKEFGSEKIIFDKMTALRSSAQILLKSCFHRFYGNLFSKLGSAGLNYHLPKLSFFTDTYCAGVSNKHCILTFFIFSEMQSEFQTDWTQIRRDIL